MLVGPVLGQPASLRKQRTDLEELEIKSEVREPIEVSAGLET